MEPTHCLVTKNRIGTDTWAENRPCKCDNCQYWLKKWEAIEELLKYWTADSRARGAS